MNKFATRLLPRILKPEIAAAALMLLFGIVFIILLRPLGTPDEPNHFVRAYEVAEGKVFDHKDGKSGCVNEVGEVSRVVNSPASAMPKSVASFTSLNRNMYSLPKQFDQPLNSREQVNVCGRQTQANSPIGYLPQALAILLLRPFNTPPVIMDYMARFFVLGAWVALISAAIKTIPVRKWAFVAVALLPISIQQSISIGADPLSIAPAALFMAILVRSYYEDRSKFAKSDVTYLTLLATIATLSKPVMVVLGIALLFYHFPNSQKVRAANLLIKQSTLLKVAAACTPVLFGLLWSVLAGHHDASATDIFRLAAEKSALFKSSPLGGARLFVVQALHYALSGLSLDEFGAFGWFQYSIPLTLRFVGVAGLILALLVGYKEVRAPFKQVSKKSIQWFNVAVITTAAGIVVANVFTLFVIWTPLNSPGVEGVQFRYFIPAFFILGSVIEARFLCASENWYRNFVLINASVFFVVSALTIGGVL